MNYKQFRNSMRKLAGIYTDVVKGTAGNLALGAIPLVGAAVQPANMAGELVATVDDYGGNKFPKEEWKKYVPGFSQYGIQRQIRKALKDAGAKSEKGLTAAQTYGTIPSSLLSGLLGAGIGAGIGAFSKDKAAGSALGAGAGAITGAAAPLLLATLLAAVRKTRTKEEQERYAQGDNEIAKHLLIPGHALYNKFKTLGRIHEDQVEAEEKDKKQKA